MIIKDVDKYFATPKVQKKYPYIYIPEADDALAILVSSLPEGELPIVITNGEKNIALNKLIPNSPIILNQLLKIFKFEYHFSEEVVVKVEKIEDIIDREDITWT